MRKVASSVTVFFLTLAPLPGQDGCVVQTYAGSGTALRGDGGPALEAELLAPGDVMYGPDGTLYIADTGNHVVRKVRPDGIIERVAGTGEAGDAGDGGPALEATFASPSELALGPDGSLYVSDHTHFRIRRIRPDGVIEAFAGNGRDDFSGDSGPATAAGVGAPSQMDTAPDGTLYLVTPLHQRVRRVRRDGVIETFAGSGPATQYDGFYAGDGGPATEARLNLPVGIAVNAEGVVFVADTRNYRIRRIGLDGVIETIRGTGGRGSSSQVGGEAISDVRSLEISPQQVLYHSEFGGVYPTLGEGRTTRYSRAQGDFTIRSDGTDAYTSLFSDAILSSRNPPEQRVSFPIAGRLADPQSHGNGGPAATAPLRYASSIATGPDGSLFVAGTFQSLIRRVSPEGVIEAFAGYGSSGYGSPAIQSSVNRPESMAVDTMGRLNWINAVNVIERVSQDGRLERAGGVDTISRCQAPSNCGEGRQASEAAFPRASQLKFASDGTAYLLDRASVGRRFETTWPRSIRPDGSVWTVPFETPDGRELSRATAITVDSENRMLIAVATGPGEDVWRWEPWGRPHASTGRFGVPVCGGVDGGRAERRPLRHGTPERRRVGAQSRRVPGCRSRRAIPYERDRGRWRVQRG